MMRALFRRAPAVLLAVFFSVCLSCADDTAKKAAEPVKDGINVYYFHTTYRCRTCNNMENYTKEALKQKFSKELKDGSIAFIPVNIDLQENTRYVNDYKLVTKSVILSAVKDGKELKWKNLDKIWMLSMQKDKFMEYVSTEAAEYITAE